MYTLKVKVPEEDFHSDDIETQKGSVARVVQEQFLKEPFLSF